MNFRSHGKLLLSGEYLVLKGAEALAIPTSYGQELEVNEADDGLITWSTFVRDELVYKSQFTLDGSFTGDQENEMSRTLSVIFRSVLELKGISELNAAEVISRLDFPMEWGLGSSSTLISNLARYTNVDAFELLEKTFGGSAYDIACATSGGPLIYSLTRGIPSWREVDFRPSFADNIHFVYLNRKKNSREAIAMFKKLDASQIEKTIPRITEISREMAMAHSIEAFGSLMEEHEAIMSDVLKIKTVKEEVFKDFIHPLKSLGAWGGDFIMALGDSHEMDYFRNRSYETIFSYAEMAFNFRNNQS